MKILNLDKLLPEPKQIILNDEKYTFQKIPSKYVLKFASLKPEDSIEKVAIILQEMFEKFSDSEKKITSNWLIENMSIEEITAVVGYLMGQDFGNEEINDLNQKKNEAD